jgi:P-type Ca2+ transporter type 2C
VVAAVEEGRVIFNRLRNVVFMLLSTNIGELLALTLSIFISGQAPLLAVQIIWNNLVTDTAVAIPLGLEPKSGDELKQPPRDPAVGIIYPGFIFRVLTIAVIMALGITVIFNWAMARMSLAEAQTLAFCTMVVFQWFLVFNARSDENSVFKLGLFRNRWLVGAVLGALALQMAVIYLPVLQVSFHTVPLSIGEWGIVVIAAGILFIIEEARKALFPKLFSLGRWQPVKSRRGKNKPEVTSGKTS